MGCQCNKGTHATTGSPASRFGPLATAGGLATEVSEDEGSASAEEREWISEGLLESSWAEMQSALNAGASSSFNPVPVERPGGGRIRDKRAPRAADVVIVRGVGGKRVPLHRLAASAWQALVAAARADGIREPLLLPVSGFRDPARQQRLWQAALQRYGSPQEARKWVAPPGSSAHQSGRAIDFYLGGRNSSANVAQLRTQPAYRWLLTNAVRFGFYPYAAEPWHWEYNPPATTQGTIQAGTRLQSELATMPRRVAPRQSRPPSATAGRPRTVQQQRATHAAMKRAIVAMTPHIRSQAGRFHFAFPARSTTDAAARLGLNSQIVSHLLRALQRRNQLPQTSRQTVQTRTSELTELQDDACPGVTEIRSQWWGQEIWLDECYTGFLIHALEAGTALALGCAAIPHPATRVGCGVLAAAGGFSAGVLAAIDSLGGERGIVIYQTWIGQTWVWHQ